MNKKYEVLNLHGKTSARVTPNIYLIRLNILWAEISDKYLVRKTKIGQNIVDSYGGMCSNVFT